MNDPENGSQLLAPEMTMNKDCGFRVKQQMAGHPADQWAKSLPAHPLRL